MSDSQTLVKKVVEVGLYGSAPGNWGKQVAVAKRLLKKNSLDYWCGIIDGMRQHVYPYNDDTPFDLFDVERKEDITRAHLKKTEDEQTTPPRWLRRGFANEQPARRPELGEEWEEK